MKLDVSDIRYLDDEQWRVLRAVEQGSRNHQVVPTPLITALAHLHHAGINKVLGALARRNLVARVQNAAYDGYRLTYGGLDFLALRTLVKNDALLAVGQQVGVGKESDIYIVTGPSLDDGEPEKRILKMHRLGRISFRNVKEKRDYLGKRKTSSWMYLSKLAAAKEIAFMQILHDHGFPVPRPFAQARHCLVMELIDAYPLRQIASIPTSQLGPLYSALMKLIVRLARAGLIHGDFNEFNLLVRELPTQGAHPEYEDGYGPDGPVPPPSQTAAVPQASSSSSPGTHSQDDSDDSDEDDDDMGNAIYIDEGVSVEPILIDFPQMMSVEHANAKFFFDRDVACVQRFFRKRFRYISSEPPPIFEEVVPASRRVQQAADPLDRSKAEASEEDEDDDHEPGSVAQDVAPSVYYQSGAASGTMAGEEDIESRFVLGIGQRRQKGKGQRMGRRKREGADLPGGDGADGEAAPDEGDEDFSDGEAESEKEDDNGSEDDHAMPSTSRAEDLQAEEDDELDSITGPRLRLDALVNATGYGNVSGGKRKNKHGEAQGLKDDRALEEAMSQLRMQDPRSRQRASDDEDDHDSSVDATEDRDSIRSGRATGASQHVSARNTHASTRPRQGQDVASRVAQERARSQVKSAKHHGAKALGSRTGRRHTGGKAKMDAVRDSAVF